jgi:cell wall-associated NlpC family hydrolase
MSRSTRKDRKSSRSLTVRNLKSEGIYFVQVRAYGKTNGKKVYSKWSEKKAAKYVYYRSNLTEVRALSLLKNAKNSRSRNALQYALARAGHPYSQARRHSGIYYDCSSLAYYAYRSAGVKIASGRDFTAAGEAYRLRGKRVSYSSMKPGALIFFSYGRNGRYRNITHVAMYAGRGMLIEAANSRIGVVYRPIHSRGSIVMICDPAK